MLCLIGALFAPLPLLGQEGAVGTVVGEVTDASTARPLVGATVNVAGTSVGRITDGSGRYILLNVPAGPRVIEVRLLGYANQSQNVNVAAGQSATANFALESEAMLLEGIVAVGYGTQSRRDVTGSVASVQAEQIRQVPTSNAVQAIQGRVAGVDIVRSSSVPGAGMEIQIRGVRSITANNDPLFVVDGVPLSGGIQDFNPSNIESIEVLKDAAATAIYGSRGANGVVLITTNTPQMGQAQITYNGYAGMQRPLNLVRMMNGPEYAEYRRIAYWTVNPNLTDADIFGNLEREALENETYTDWQREILRTGFQQDHQIGVNAATESTRFSLTGNFFQQDGITVAQGFERYTTSISVDHTRGRLRVGANGSATRSSQETGPGNGLWGAALANHHLGSPYDENGLLKPKANDDPLLVNPLVTAYQNITENQRNRTFGSFFAEYELLDGLSVRSTFGPDLTKTTNGNFQSRLARNNSPPSASKSEGETFAYTWTNLVNLNREFAGAHRLDLSGIYEIQENRSQSSNLAAEDLPYDHQLWHNLSTAGIRTTLDSNFSRWALQSYVGRINYTLLDRYNLSLSGRYDGSSRLAPDNRWSFFPSVGVAWQLGDEAFMQNLGWFSDLKLRGSYGVTGNTAINPYQTQGTLTNTAYNFGNTAAFGWRPGAIPNPALEWEKTHQYNIGMDFGVLRNRVTGTVDIYRQDTKDLLLTRGLPGSTGFTSVLQNVGETRNSGIELALSTVNVENWNGLRWTMDINATHNKNEIIALSTAGDQIGNTWFIGEPIHGGNNCGVNCVFYDYEFAGIWQLDEAAEAASYNQKPGEIKVMDQNADGRISLTDDRVIIGNSYPDWLGSLSNRFTYRNLDLSVLASARLGYMFNDAFAGANNVLAGRYNNILVDYWTPDKCPAGSAAASSSVCNSNPRPDQAREDPIYSSSRRYLKGDHYRIRNITLGYRVPQGLIERLGGSTARIYATMQEPYVFTDYYGYDPENGTAGGTPSYWTLLIGTNLTF
jgi:TonB-linked SusC/RagA family outer membrane protein